MATIVPAIIDQEYKEIEARLKSLEGLVEWAQIDIADGLFAHNFSWENVEDLKTLPGKLKLEAHLMIEHPEEYVEDWMSVVDRVLVHPESTERLPEILQKFESSPSKLGLALLMRTPLSILDEHAGKFNHVQLMAIQDIGFQGQKFDQNVIDRVRAVREKFPSVTIAVDGGVNLENAPSLITAGATHLVIGSAIWQSSNLAEAIKSFQNL